MFYSIFDLAAAGSRTVRIHAQCNALNQKPSSCCSINQSNLCNGTARSFAPSAISFALDTASCFSAIICKTEKRMAKAAAVLSIAVSRNHVR